MRVDNAGRNDIIQPNIGLEIKEPDTVETNAKPRVEPQDEVASYGVAATRVDKALFSWGSELERITEAAKASDFEQLRKEMSALFYAMGGADIGALGDEGYSLNGTQADTIVTVMDKIKMELAKSGADISIFGDSLSMEQIEKMTGSAGQAMQMAARLRDCTDGDIAYLAGNGLEPTIENIYTAQHSGGARAAAQGQPLPEDENFRKQVEQVISQAGLPVDGTTMGYGQLLLDNEIPLTPENVAYVDQLKQLSLPLQPQEVEDAIAKAVQEGKAPQEAYLMDGYAAMDRAMDAWEAVAEASEEVVTGLVLENKEITIGNLWRAEHQDAQGEGSQRQGGQTEAERIRKAALTASQEAKSLTARRQLEETRLVMTVQANYRLLRKGISIETLGLEQLVEELKDLENDYYRDLLTENGMEATPERTQSFRDAVEQTEALKWMPSYVLGESPLDVATVHSLYDAGASLKAALEHANEAYETMMTTPRADLGDSMQKAFRNVDAILEDLGLAASEANQRAVRILAYNRLEITTENIAQMKAADQKMQNLFQNMKPQVVLEMIREGINPLETDIETLNAKAEEIRARLDPGQEERYSKYLWELEQDQAITPEERESYIGIYRLLRQIEKSDGAVIGAVVNQGGELSLKNLLTATRSRRARGMQLDVDTDVTSIEAKRDDASISRQIEAAYQADCAKEALERLEPELIREDVESGAWQEMTPEQLLWQMKAQQEKERTDDRKMAEQELRYQEQQQELFGKNMVAEDTVLKILTDYSLPVDTYHIMAAGQMVNNRNAVFKKLFDPAYLEKEPDLAEAKEALLERFAEAVKTPEEMAEAQNTLAEVAEHVMDGMIDETNVTSQDIQELRMLRTQIQIGGAMAREENYAIPVMIADEMTNVQLKIVRGKKGKGMVDILFETERLGRVAARIMAAGNRIEGFLASDKAGTLDLMRDQEGTLREQLSDGEGDKVRFDYAYQSDLDLGRFLSTSKNVAADPASEDYRVQTRTLYHMAKVFIDTVKRAA